MGKVKVVDNTIHTTKIFLYKRFDNQNLFLVLKEPEGLYGFVGGAQDEDDNSIENTAKRELMEEIGLTSKSYKLKELSQTLKFIHEDVNSDRYGKKGVLHLFTAQYNESEKIILADDLINYEWMPKDEVHNKLKKSYSVFQRAFPIVTNELEQKVPT